MTTQLSEQQTNTARIASEMIENGMIVATDGHTLNTYDESLGRYVPAETRIRADLIQRLGESWTPRNADSVLSWLSDFATRLWDTPPLDRVNVRNGILDIHTKELAPHSKDFLSPVQIDAEWDPGAECPRIDRFVAEVFPTDSEQLFFELAGLYITPDTKQQVAVMLSGNGANGRSVTIELITRLLGHRNVSNVSLQRYAGGKRPPPSSTASSSTPLPTFPTLALRTRPTLGRLSMAGAASSALTEATGDPSLSGPSPGFFSALIARSGRPTCPTATSADGSSFPTPARSEGRKITS